MTTIQRLIQIGIDSRGAKRGAVEVEQAFDRVGKGAKRGRDALVRFDAKQNEVASGAKRAGVAIGALFGGLSATLAVRGTIRLFAEYEDTLAQVALVSKATAEETARLVDVSRQLGATTRFTATQAGEGLLFLARAGFSVNEAIEAVPATLNLATAGVLDLGEAADFASNILSQFQLETSETERVVDTLINTANNANTDVRQLAEAMKFAGPVAGALGISIENTAAAIGVLGDSGIQASLAGTNLRGILATLLDPTTEAKKAIQDLVGSLDELDPTTNTITDIFGKLTAAQLTAADAVTIFGRRNAAAALVLGNGVEKINALTKANEEAKGIAEEYARVLSQTVIGRTKSFVSAVQELALQIGETSSRLTVFVDFLTDVARFLGGTTKEGEEASVAVRLFAAGVKSATIAIGALIALKIVQFFNGMAKAIFTADVAMKSLTRSNSLFLAALSAIAGFNLGNILFDEFKQVQEDALGIVRVFQEVGVNIEFFFKKSLTSLSAFIFGAAARIVEKVRSTLDPLLTTLSTVESITGRDLGISLIRTAVSQAGVFAKGAEDASLEEVKNLGVEQKAAIKQIRELTRLELENIRVEFERKGKESGRSFVDAYIDNLEKNTDRILAALLPETESLSGQLAELAGRKDDALSVDPDNVDRLQDYAKAMQEVADAAAELERRTGLETLDSQIRALEEEISLLRLSESARENRTQVLRFEAEAIELLGATSEEAAARTDLFAEQLERLTEARELRKVAEDIGDAFGDAFERVAFDSRSAIDALREFGIEASRIAFRQFVTGQLSSILAGGIQSGFGPGGLFGGGSRTGNIVDRGSYVAFANGGIVDQPTLFPMSGGRTGIMGEGNKPEAIVPLPDGRRIPVEMRGEQGNITINAPVTIQTPDIGSFGRSRHQISREVVLMHRRARR